MLILRQNKQLHEFTAEQNDLLKSLHNG